MTTIEVVDLFGGPGGWSESARALGLTEVGIEHDAAACATRAAAGHLTIRANVATYPAERFRGVEGLIASPPCPTFSSAGKGEGIGDLPELHRHAHACVTGWKPSAYAWSDPRTPLVLEPLRWAWATQPTWIALEQVPPVLPVWESTAYVLRAWGYSVWCGILNAADYGVPQTRKRAILLAHRSLPVTAPEPTHAREPGDSLFGQRLPWVSMAQALGWTDPRQVGFPRLDDRGDSPDGYRERDWREGDEPAFALTEKARSWVVRTGSNSMVTSRTGSKAGDGGVEPYERSMDEPAPTLDAKVGGAWTAFVRTGSVQSGEPGTRHEQPLEVPGPTVTSRADLWTLHTNRDQREDGSRQVCDTSAPAPAPALAAKSGPQWELCPPGAESGAMGQGIKLTVRDALILQSFRPDYPVQGTKTKQFEQIGNAIPPLLARAVLGQLVAAVEAAA